MSALREAYAGKRVLVLGHTGFKGSWLTLWLSSLGARVTGYALPPENGRNLFREANVASDCRHIEGDLIELEPIATLVDELRPEFIFHLAAQSLVRRSYDQPIVTFQTNVIGTANVLEAVRATGVACAVVVVTSDKCYENDGRGSPHDEGDRLGGQDPYSASKAAAEIVTASYRSSFFPSARLDNHGVAVATARSGNVIGGGDWSEDRLLPDAVRALERGIPVPVRNPESVRPWQHVLDPLEGYLLLGAGLAARRTELCEAWNFGPDPESSRTVREVVEELLRHWGEGTWVRAEEDAPPPESAHLTLSSEKARRHLHWTPRWGFEKAVLETIQWYREAHEATAPGTLANLCRRQIAEHAKAA